MWNIFGRYKGRKALPSARQMNLIAAILNHVTQGPGIAMKTPQLPSTDTPWVIGVDVEWLKAFVGGGGTSGATGSLTVVTDVVWTGTQLRKKTRTLTLADGLVSEIGNETTTTIDTAVTYNP